MIASWMAYTALVSLALTVAGLAVERVAVGRGWPIRWIWAGALTASVVWPLVFATWRALPRTAEAVAGMPFTITVAPAQIITSGPDRAALLDRGLVVLWVVLSGLLAVRLSHAVTKIGRRRRAWRADTVDGTAVRLSRDVGPAVVGLHPMDVVLPEWILSLDAPLRAIVLCHEEEHRAARDPYLLFGATVAVTLMPWNLALWFQMRRLRLSVEMDCDARVLRAHPPAERYGLLMLTIAQRRSAMPFVFAPMLSETQLERRIIAMQTTHRIARLSAYTAAAIALTGIAFACSLRTDATTAPQPPAAARSEAPAAAKYTEFQVTSPAHPAPDNTGPRYPDMLRQANLEGSVLAQFVVDTTGRVDMKTFRAIESSHDLFIAAVRSALPDMKFIPATANGRKVRQLLEMPFEFDLQHGDAPAVQVTAAPIANSVYPPKSPDSTGKRILRLPRVRVPITIPSAAELSTRPRSATPTWMPDNATFFEYQVERPVMPVPGNSAPRYPDVLRLANVQGEVLAQFVVDTGGRADMSSFTVVRSTHELFTDAVRKALPNMQFKPAEVGGHPVKQVLQMPFQFSLAK